MSPSPRVKFMDPDYRREPKTSHFCSVCQRDLKPGQSFRVVHCVDGGMNALHPDDEEIYASAANDGSDMGSHPIGADCARKLGLEWSVPASAEWLAHSSTASDPKHQTGKEG